MPFTEIEINLLRTEIEYFINFPPEKFELLFRSIFCNYLLRFVVVDGKTYPAYIQIFIGYQRLIEMSYTNPHQRNVRLGYNFKKNNLFIEKIRPVSHFFSANQQVTEEDTKRCMIFSDEQINYTKPVSCWKKTEQELFIEQIASVKIESFVDEPLFWGDDKYAYKLIIKTKNTHP